MSGDEVENPIDTIGWNDDLLVKEYEKCVKENPSLENNSKETEAVDDNVLYQKGDSTDKVKSSNERKVKFKIGDYARAVYNDGYEYEGQILQLDEDTEICQLIYIGYGDEQAVKIEDLTESWGRQARRDQFLKAKQDGKNSHKVKKKVPTNFPPELNQLPQPPPMPPAPQGLGEDSEHLSTMLMSWYKSGYYTGFYQGLKSAQTTTKRKKAS